jgi:LysR family transcriptional regulator, transcriptional activator for bauABCD operon
MAEVSAVPEHRSAPLPRLDAVDIRLLRIFAAIVDAGGFSAAQIALNVSQSTISAKMAELETRLGSRLCRRGRGGFALTDSGRRVYEASQGLFRALDEFSALVGDMRGALVGDLHIAALDALASNPDCRLSDAIDRFKAHGGAVHLTLHIANPLEIERAVLEGRYHLGIASFPSHAPGLSYRFLFDEEQRLYCGRGHPFFRRAERSLSVRECEGADYVRRGYYAGSLKPGRFRPRNETATAFNMEATATMILSGRYIGHLPAHYASQWVERGALRPLLPAKLTYRTRFEAVHRKGPAPAPAIELFHADLLAAFGQTDAPENPGARAGQSLAKNKM